MKYTIAKPKAFKTCTVAYGTKLQEMKEMYEDDMHDFVLSIKQSNNKEKYQKALLIYSLLVSSPKNQQFPCYLSFLNAAEVQIKHWLRL